jgi:hypothetical protein
VRFYVETRDRIREQMVALCRRQSLGRADVTSAPRIVFFGAGEVAEIGYVCLQGTDLTLVGVVDDEKAGRTFFDFPIRSASDLRPGGLVGVSYDHLLVMTFGDTTGVEQLLIDLQIPPDRVHWL